MVGLAAKDHLYFALNKREMAELVNTKHLQKLLSLPTQGANQQKSIEQIELIMAGRWRQFLTPSQTELLNDKVADLREGEKRIDLLNKILAEQKGLELKTKETKAKQKQAQQGVQMTAVVTRYLLDAPARVTEGKATYDQQEKHVTFYHENTGGHRYNHRCGEDGIAYESDSIITKDAWERDQQYQCSIESDSTGLPSSVILRTVPDEFNPDAFVAIRASFSPQPQAKPVKLRPAHCPQTEKSLKNLIALLESEKTSSSAVQKQYSAIRPKTVECY